jgi:hypothetical protein
MRRTLFTAALLLAAGPAFAVNPAVTEVTCAAAVTEGQAVRDLKPSFLPVLPYKQEPGDKEFKQLAMFGDVPVRLYVYRVNEQMLRVRIFEDGPAGRELLADTDLDGEMTQLSYRPIGGDRMVTAYCY